MEILIMFKSKAVGGGRDLCSPKVLFSMNKDIHSYLQVTGGTMT